MQPLWLRVVAYGAILLVLFGSFAQAAHIHGDFLPHHDQRASAVSPGSLLAGDEASCPLCIAMHSALAEQSQTHEMHLVTVERRFPAIHQLVRESVLHFSLFSRPPPAGD